MMRIGIYGGTFNPPHIGHIQAAAQGIQALNLDKLLLIPDRIAPHKEMPQDSPSPRQRLKMLEMAAKGQTRMQVSDLELQREGKSYTYETVLQLKEQYPTAQLVLLMGTDMFLSLETWKHPEVILENAVIGVFYRGQTGEQTDVLNQKARMEKGGATVELVENDICAISSTDLRRLLTLEAAGSFLPEGVEAYIRENGLYTVNENRRNLSLAALEQAATALLKPNRVAHVLGCRDTAVALAKYWGADETHAARAALLHDVTKALDGPLQLTLCKEYGILLSAFSSQNPKTLHAITGAEVAKRIFGECDAVVNAIRHHTTGKADMCLLEKIIYVADYMEPNRDFPGVEELRNLAFSNIDEALKLGLTMTIDMLNEQGREVSGESLEALAWLNRKEETLC